ncbi:MAG: adenylosuccinate synthase [Deltaproteobacteria bacterium]|nr:MAG: adenylosuccinate synthase [Deltaproteobacteria bacterium]TMB29923.1 MAG: adenylosuccinate synthase [Deltaproteobacteria bacterium]
MSNVVIVGAQWGDEGKGKIVDLFTSWADVVVRFQGGANAGHTLVVGGTKTVLHLVPSGVLHPGKRCFIGNGVVVDPEALSQEIDILKSRGLLVEPQQLVVSENAHVIFPYHKRIDLGREEKSGRKKIGTTGRGIGPCYEDKVARRGIRMRDLLKPEVLRERLKERIGEANAQIAALGGEQVKLETVHAEAARLGQKLAEYVGDASEKLAHEVERGKAVLFEGAQGTLLDVDHGTYPYVTSSNTVAGNAAVGAGLGPTSIHSVIGITKAYTTRVGNGPLPTELDDASGERLRTVGAEFGATTGRPRRCGWMDALVLRYAARVNGLSGLALTKLDVLTGFDKVQVAVAYKLPSGKTLQEFPSDPELLASAQPVYEELPGWKEPIGDLRQYEELPANARRYVERVEQLVGVEAIAVSVGAERAQTIVRKNPFRHT